MVEYSTAQVDDFLADEVNETRPSPMRWRRFGFAAATLATVCALVGATSPRAPTPFEEMQHTVIKTHFFIQKVVERSLMAAKSDGGPSTTIGFTLKEKDRTPNAMKMTAHLRPSTDDVQAEVIFSFRAKPDHGSKLHDKLKVLFAVGEVSKGAISQTKELLSRLKPRQDGDDVHIHLAPTEEELKNVPHFDDIDQGIMQSEQSFKFEMGTGHDFGEIVSNANPCPATLFGGVKVSMSTSLADALAESLVSECPFDLCEHKKQIEMFEALDSLSADVTTTYTKEKLEKTANCTADKAAEAKASMEELRQTLPHYAFENFGGDFVEALTGLAEDSEGFRSIRFVGMLPASYELALEFENLKLTPVFKEFFTPKH